MKIYYLTYYLSYIQAMVNKRKGSKISMVAIKYIKFWISYHRESIKIGDDAIIRKPTSQVLNKGESRVGVLNLSAFK